MIGQKRERERTAIVQCVGCGPQFIVIVDQFHHKYDKYANISNLEAFLVLYFSQMKKSGWVNIILIGLVSGYLVD